VTAAARGLVMAAEWWGLLMSHDVDDDGGWRAMQNEGIDTSLVQAESGPVSGDDIGGGKWKAIGTGDFFFFLFFIREMLATHILTHTFQHTL